MAQLLEVGGGERDGPLGAAAAAHDWQRWQKTEMRASISVRAGEPGAAAPAGLTLAPIHQQLQLEVARLAGAGPVVPDGRAVGCDGGLQDAADLPVQPAVVVRRESRAGFDGSIPAANSASFA